MAASINRAVGKWTETAQVGQLDTQALLDAASELNIQDLAVRRVGHKLVITGRARYQLDRDLFWDAIRQIDGWEEDVVLDLEIERHDIRGFYTVGPGETLAGIARRCLGSESRDWDIFDANRDRMNDPEQIFAGQQLLIPRR